MVIRQVHIIIEGETGSGIDLEHRQAIRVNLKCIGQRIRWLVKTAATGTRKGNNAMPTAERQEASPNDLSALM